jgi:lysine 2,3-aminomutase
VKGINDDVITLAELLEKLSIIGVPAYYIFQCRPALGNEPYSVPLEIGYWLIEEAKRMVPGLAKRARYVMSHSSGKVEILGQTEGFVYLKYHSTPGKGGSCRILVFRSNPQARWLDDYIEMTVNNGVAAI